MRLHVKQKPAFAENPFGINDAGRFFVNRQEVRRAGKETVGIVLRDQIEVVARDVVTPQLRKVSLTAGSSCKKICPRRVIVMLSNIWCGSVPSSSISI